MVVLCLTYLYVVTVCVRVPCCVLCFVVVVCGGVWVVIVCLCVVLCGCGACAFSVLSMSVSWSCTFLFPVAYCFRVCCVCVVPGVCTCAIYLLLLYWFTFLSVVVCFSVYTLVAVDFSLCCVCCVFLCVFWLVLLPVILCTCANLLTGALPVWWFVGLW